MRGRWIFLAALPAAFALGAVGCSGGSAGAKAAGGAGDAGASIAPKGAPLYVSVDSDLSSSQWDAANALLAKFPGKDKLLNQLRSSFEKSAQLSWQNDVKPALGPEVDVVLLDLKSNPDVVALTQPKDESAFKRLVDKANSDPSSKLVVEDYKGWKIVSDSQAVLDRFKQDAAAGTLADESTFGDAMGKLSNDALAKLYVDGPKVTEALKGAISSSGLGSLGVQGKLVSGVAELVPEKDGLRLDGTLTSEGASAGESYASSLVDQVPAGALAFLSFNGATVGEQMRKQLQDALKGLAGNVPGGQLLVPIVQQIGPIFAHENALYVRSGTPIPEVTLVTTPDSPSAAMTTADAVISGFAGIAGLQVKPTAVTISGVQAKSLQIGPVTIYYGADGNKFVITDEQRAFADLKATGNRLSDDPTFKEAMSASGMPGKTGGFVYLNLKDGIPLIESLVQLTGRSVPSEVSDNLQPLRTFVAWGQPSGNEQRFSTFLELR
jgi:hypothetical protein